MMIADRALSFAVRTAAPWVWRNPKRVARKLAEFSATEAGSALDMLRAVELETDPKLRRIFLRHALDEARHARLFQDGARRVDAGAAADLSQEARIHGHRQDLYERLGLVDFLAFVHLAERRGETHFRALLETLARDPDLVALFDGVARDERFHLAYSGRWLARVEASRSRSRSRSRGRSRGRGRGRGRGPATALRRGTLRAAWAAWRRGGRAIGARTAELLLRVLYFVVLPPFAIAQRFIDPDRPGWKAGRTLPASVAAARRQF
ncbi:MAG: ferritin-like domain-containing protein [Deltaproteobacteria bacterium]|nr:ferritin-like domain-containing protein [Deltaproteobacteria bacterium]